MEAKSRDSDSDYEGGTDLINFIKKKEGDEHGKSVLFFIFSKNKKQKNLIKREVLSSTKYQVYQVFKYSRLNIRQ